jgi:hypothetical protein
MIRSLTAFLLASLLLSQTGCGGGNTPGKGDLSEANKAALAELGNTLKQLASEKKKAPAKLAELDPFDPMMPEACPAIRNGSIIYIWGAGIDEGATNVIAYDKETPDKGGYVLLSNCTVKSMSAADFQAAGKAKK